MLDLGEAIRDAKDSACCGSHRYGVAQFVVACQLKFS
jgi:hypothetical protein